MPESLGTLSGEPADADHHAHVVSLQCYGGSGKAWASGEGTGDRARSRRVGHEQVGACRAYLCSVSSHTGCVTPARAACAADTAPHVGPAPARTGRCRGMPERECRTERDAACRNRFAWNLHLSFADGTPQA